MITEILVILALIVVNGVLAMSELAIVSARPGRLKSLETKSRGARMALRLAEHPGRFGSYRSHVGITPEHWEGVRKELTWTRKG